MAIRSDLVSKLTPEMVLSGMLANQHRYRPEPRLATTGTGSLSATTPADIKQGRKLRKAINRKILTSSKKS